MEIITILGIDQCIWLYRQKKFGFYGSIPKPYKKKSNLSINNGLCQWHGYISWFIHSIALKGMINIIYIDIIEAILKELEESFSKLNNTIDIK